MSDFAEHVFFSTLEDKISPFDDKEKVCFLEYEDGYSLSPKCIIRTELTGGAYEALSTREGLYFLKTDIISDTYIDLNNSKETEIIKEIFSFNEKRELFQNNGMIHKRGILLHGQPGCGKTSFINFFLKKFIATGGIAFVVNSPEKFVITVNGLKQIKQINPNKQVVVILEEIDRYEQYYSQLQNFLDGADSIQNLITFATTNNIKNLPPEMLRPSRFDWIISFDKLSTESRKKYLLSKNISEEIAEKWAKDTENFTIAMLKELFVNVHLLENDYDLVLKKLKDSEKYMLTSTYKGIGFNKDK